MSEAPPSEPPLQAGERKHNGPEAAPAGQRPGSRSAPRRGGRGAAWFALLVALIALALAAWPWYGHRLPAVDTPDWLPDRGPAAGVAALERETAELSAQTSTTAQQLTELERSLADARAQLTDAAQAMRSADFARTSDLETLEEDLRGELTAAIRAATPGRTVWMLAEAEYLLRLANHRLMLERDPVLAHRMLGEADRMLVALDDPSLHDVRATIAEERAALEAVPVPDLEGAFLRLDAIKQGMDALPIRQPEHRIERPDTDTAAEDDESLWAQLQTRLSQLFEFRRHDPEGVRPLLGAEQAGYLEMNLRLTLERAQLALLREQQQIYSTSLEQVRHWLSTYMDPTHRRVSPMIGEIDELLALQLRTELPDISRSLARLRAWRAQTGLQPTLQAPGDPADVGDPAATDAQPAPEPGEQDTAPPQPAPDEGTDEAIDEADQGNQADEGNDENGSENVGSAANAGGVTNVVSAEKTETVAPGAGARDDGNGREHGAQYRLTREVS